MIHDPKMPNARPNHWWGYGYG